MVFLLFQRNMREDKMRDSILKFHGTLARFFNKGHIFYVSIVMRPGSDNYQIANATFMNETIRGLCADHSRWHYLDITEEMRDVSLFVEHG